MGLIPAATKSHHQAQRWLLHEMSDALPFQPQGIPTLTMYERTGGELVILDSGLSGAPVLGNFRLGSPGDDNTSEPELLNARPALAALVWSPTVDANTSDGPLGARSSLSAFVYDAPVDASSDENVLDSTPALSVMLRSLPVDDTAIEEDTLGSNPGLSAMTKL